MQMQPCGGGRKGRKGLLRHAVAISSILVEILVWINFDDAIRDR